MTAAHPSLHSSARRRPDRESVVLLHSSAASARQWDALAERLRPAFEVLAIDLHGHGRQAPWRGDQALSVHDEVAIVLPAIERAGGAHLIGHSYGGAVALHLAAARPSLVRSLAVYEPVLFHHLAHHEPLGAATREVIDLVDRMRALVAAGQAADAAERFVDYWSGTSAWLRLGPEPQRSIISRMPLVMQHFDTLFAEPLPEARLTDLTMPALCLTGERSTAAARRLGRLLRTLLPGAQHETLAGLTHMGPIANAPLVNDRLLHFLGVEGTLHIDSHRSPLHPEVRPDASTTPDHEYAP